MMEHVNTTSHEKCSPVSICKTISITQKITKTMILKLVSPIYH